MLLELLVKDSKLLIACSIPYLLAGKVQTYNWV